MVYPPEAGISKVNLCLAASKQLIDDPASCMVVDWQEVYPFNAATLTLPIYFFNAGLMACPDPATDPENY